MKSKFLYSMIFALIAPVHLFSMSDVQKKQLKQNVEQIMQQYQIPCNVTGLAIILQEVSSFNENIDFEDEQQINDAAQVIIQHFVKNKCNIKDTFYISEITDNYELTVEQAQVLIESHDKVSIPELFSSACPFAAMMSPITMQTLAKNGFKDLMTQDSFMTKLLQKFLKLHDFVMTQKFDDDMSESDSGMLGLTLQYMYYLQETIEYVRTLKSGFAVNKTLIKDYQDAVLEFEVLISLLFA